MSQSVVFVHARAADAVLRSGAAIAEVASRGGEATVVAALPPTDAERAAVASLGARLLQLGTPPARWIDRAPRDYTESGPEAFLAAEQGETAADVAAVVHAVEADALVAPAETGSPDERQALGAALAAAQVMGVPLFEAVERGGNPVVASSAARSSAVRALGLGDSAAPERYARRRNDPPPPGRLAHALTAVLAAVLGAVAGVAMTVIHQSSLTLGGVEVPWGAIEALAVVAALLAGLRFATGSRIVAGAAAVALLVICVVLASPVDGGTVLVPANTAGYLWTFGPAVIAALVLAWPRIPQAAAGRIAGHPAVKGSDHP